MKEFLQILRRFVPPYKKYLGLSILFNILSAVLNIFSFAALIPILQILFQVDGGIRVNEYMHWNGDWGSIKEVATITCIIIFRSLLLSIVHQLPFWSSAYS